MTNGKGPRLHRNVSTRAYRDGFDYWKRCERMKRSQHPSIFPNEILWKNWLREESQRLGIKPHALTMRLKRGVHPMPVTRVVNSRVIYVRR